MQHTIFNKLIFSEDQEIMDFVESMSFDKAISILLMALNYAHDRGAFDFNEAKLVDKALTVLKDPMYARERNYTKPSKHKDSDGVVKARQAVDNITIDVHKKRFQERLIDAKLKQTGIFKRHINFIIVNGKILRMLLKLDHVNTIGEKYFYGDDIEIIIENSMTDDHILFYFNGKHLFTANLIL